MCSLCDDALQTVFWPCEDRRDRVLCDDLQIVPVSSNVSWANTPIIALYCTQYKALFGSVNLKQELTMKMSGRNCCSGPDYSCCTSPCPQ